MQYLKLSGETGDEAVSPVVGVMLMLVVVIIIAAIVSGFAGGLVGSASQNAPTLAMDVKIINTGSWSGSGFFATVTAVSKAIDSNDIKIVTSWTAENGGDPVSGGNTTLPRVINTHYFYSFGTGSALEYNGPGGTKKKKTAHAPLLNSANLIITDPSNCVYPGSGSLKYGCMYGWIAPLAIGPGLMGSTDRGSEDSNPTTYSGFYQQFGVYSLVTGTALTAPPCGQGSPQNLGGSAGSGAGQGYGVVTSYSYTGGPYSDPITALLGANWEMLREGDKVNVKVIYTPTGAVIFDKNVPVTEA
ncbi:MAG: type IV pilin [Methanoregula sp.]